MKYYLAGPMSGVPKCNFPAFDAAAKALRKKGYTIVSPSELDAPAERRRALRNKSGNPVLTGHSWGTFLARDVKLIADECQGIIFLPNWHKSRGAVLEAFVGLLCEHAFFTYSDGEIFRLASERVWRRATAFGL